MKITVSHEALHSLDVLLIYKESKLVQYIGIRYNTLQYAQRKWTVMLYCSTYPYKGLDHTSGRF